MKVKIIDMDHLGNGIGKIDNKVIFVPKAVPGDLCEINIIKNNKKYDVAKIEEIIEPSIDRTKASCPFYHICGGCNISNLNYKKQLDFKINKIKNIFKKYLNIDIFPNIIPSEKEYNYRNKITYHIDNKEIGLIGEFDKFISIEKCQLVSDEVNNLYKEIRKKDLSNVKLITIKECDNGLILSINGNMNIDNLKTKCISIYMNNKCIYYKEDGYIFINNLKFFISNSSFFQINTTNIKKLYDLIIKYGDFTKNDQVIDLYCGVGSITLYVAKYVKNILGIEIIEDAIIDAKRNATINNITNAKFICGDVSKLNEDDIKGNILIVDPPRVGLDSHTKKIINNKQFKRIIYVSCNPMTLVRDIKEMDNYKLEKITLVDMFPQTHHTECVCLLTLRN